MFDKLFKRFFDKATPVATSTTHVLLYAPVSGQLIPLEQVSDPMFAQKMLGDGMAIEPSSQQIVAPFDGTVVAPFPTGHAIGLRSQAGLECLIHIGIDTVTLHGQGFRLLVEQGQKIGRGTPLIDLDLAVLLASGKDLVTPVVITNSEDWLIEQRCEQSTILAGTDILFIARPADNATL